MDCKCANMQCVRLETNCGLGRNLHAQERGSKLIGDQLLFMAGVGAEKKMVGEKIFIPPFFLKTKFHLPRHWEVKRNIPQLNTYAEVKPAFPQLMEIR